MFTGANTSTCRKTPGQWGTAGRTSHGRARRTYSGEKTVIAVLLSVEDPVFDEDGDGPQHKRHEEVHVDEVAGAVQLPTPTGGEDRRLEVGNPAAFHPPRWGPLRADSTALSQGGCPPSSQLSKPSLTPRVPTTCFLQ